MRTSRSAFSLVEVMVMVLIGAILMVLVLGSYSKFGSSFAIGTADLELQSDAQLLFRNLAADVSAAQLMSSSKDSMDRFDFAADKKLVILTSKMIGSDDPARIQQALDLENAGNDYPSFPLENETAATVQKYDLNQVTYSLEPHAGVSGSFEIFREEIEGEFVRTEKGLLGTGDSTFTYSFTAKQNKGKKKLASYVTKLDLKPLAFVQLGQGQQPITGHDTVLPLRKKLSIWTADPNNPIATIAGVGIGLQMKRQLQGAKGPEGSIEVVTKLWMEAATLAFRYDNDFSSRDSSLSY